MTRIAVIAASDTVHRSLRTFVEQTPDVTISLRLRTERELRSVAAIDVVVVDADLVSDLEALVERVEPAPLVLVGSAPGAARLADRLDGSGVVADWEPERVIAAARAAALGLHVYEQSEWGVEEGGSDSSVELTSREFEVLELLARGSTNAQIAIELGVSTNTIKFHVAGLYQKLGVNSRSEAAWQAFHRGILSL